MPSSSTQRGYQCSIDLLCVFRDTVAAQVDDPPRKSARAGSRWQCGLACGDAAAARSHQHLWATLKCYCSPRTRHHKIVAMFIGDPAYRGTSQASARHVGRCESTLARLSNRETSMSLVRWRWQLRLLLAVQWLGTRVSVQQGADDLVHERAASFVTIFGNAPRTSPGRYRADRRMPGPRLKLTTSHSRTYPVGECRTPRLNNLLRGSEKYRKTIWATSAAVHR